MGLKEALEDNALRDGTLKYDRYAKISMVFGIIIICLPLLFYLAGYLHQLSVQLNNDTIDNLASFMFIFIPTIMVVLAILGVIFGIKGLKSEKVGMSIAGLVISGAVLLLSLIIVIYFAAGGEIM